MKRYKIRLKHRPGTVSILARDKEDLVKQMGVKPEYIEIISKSNYIPLDRGRPYEH